MKILIVSATQAEIQPFLDQLEVREPVVPYALEICISGVGMVATAFRLGQKLSTNTYDLVLNVGIAGAIDQNLALCSSVWIVEDGFYGFGAENHDSFLDVFELGLVLKNELPFSDGKLLSSPIPEALKLDVIPKVNATTVQTVHGSLQGIEVLRARNAHIQVESMEGAAVLYSAAMAGVPVIQFRTISNYVEPRNKNNWKIKDAIENLNNQLISWFLMP